VTEADARRLAEGYSENLREYLADASEASLTRGYDIARRALVEGRGVLDVAAIHHRALRRVAAECPITDALLKNAGDFLAECLSPFEMSHRGAREGTRALRHLNEVLEGEMKRIAHALHDEAGQLLGSVHIALAGLAAELPPQARPRLDGIENLLRQIEGELRDLSHGLRPTVLDNLGLVAGLELLAEKVAKRTGMVVFVEGELRRRWPANVETALYRIVQEALNNVSKHAGASSVRIKVRSTSSKIACSVSDDGRGFDWRPEAEGQGLGLLGIRERLNALGGSLQVDTGPRRGTTLVADIPLGASYARVAGG
jgi:signal transduction histidine kinase